MRLNLNLATQPYENARGFYARWGLLLGGVALVTALLIMLAVRGWNDAHREARKIESDRQEISRLHQEASQAKAVLDQPQNRDRAQEAAYINELIARKAFSWTQVFTDLEKIMPAELRVMSIQPVLDADNQLELRMTIEGQSRERVVQLLRHMEDSPRFREPALRAESFAQGNSGGPMQFQISALYLPQPPSATSGGAP